MRIHLVLSAGGALCLSYAGSIAALEAAGFELASVSACSAGTFLGGLAAAGMRGEALVRVVLDLNLRKLAGRRRFHLPKPFNKVGLLFKPYAEYDVPGLPEFLRTVLKGDPLLAVDPAHSVASSEVAGQEAVRSPTRLKIPFATAGVDILSERILVYSSQEHPEMHLSEVVQIATAFPLAYKPYEPEGRIVLDAALASMAPVWLAPVDDAPSVLLQPRHSPSRSYPKNFRRLLGSAIEAGIRCRDRVAIEQMPSLRVVDIDCGEFSHDSFGLTRGEVSYLVTAGRDAVHAALKHYGETLQTPVPRAPPRTPATAGASRDDRAQRRGDELLATFSQAVTAPVRDKVFISYSREDQRWLDRFLANIKPILQNTAFLPWSDRSIAPGERWRPAIHHAISTARVAVVLVSQTFLGSEFVIKEELPALLAAAASQKLVVLCVHLTASVWQSTAIKDLQSASNPEKPLDTLKKPERNKALVDISWKVHEAMVGQSPQVV